MELLIIIFVVGVFALNQAETKRKQDKNRQEAAARTQAHPAAKPVRRTGRYGADGTWPADPGRREPEGKEQREPSYRQAASAYPDRTLPHPDLCEDSCKWSFRNKRQGEDELEALIRRNHEHEKHLEQRLMVQDKNNG